MGKEYTNGPIWLDTGGGGQYIATDSTNIAGGVEASDNGSGSLYAHGEAITGQQPTFNVSSRSLDSVFDNIGLTGACVGSAFSIASVRLYQRNLTNCQSGAASHRYNSMPNGLLRLGALSANRGEDASVTILGDAITNSTGTTAPLGASEGVSFPALGVIDVNRFTLGLITVNGVAYDEIDALSIEFGVSITTKRPKLARIWPQSVGVLMVRPTITLTGRDASKITNTLLAAGGEAAAHANTKIRFKKRSSSAAFVPDGNAEHINITANGLHLPDNVLSASGTSEASSSTTLMATFDITNAPVVISTGVAYSEA